MSDTTTTTNSTQQATATPEESAMEKLQLQRLQNNSGNQQALDTNMYNTMNTILTGGKLNGNLQGINGISEDQTQSMVNASLRDIAPQFQSSGILNSGTAAQIAGRTAMDTRNSNAQFNVSALQNLFNQALGGSSNLSAATTNQNQVLGSQLAGLRTINGSQSTTSNPFLNSFYKSLGEGLGSTATSAANAGVGAATGGGGFGSSFMKFA